MDGAQTDLTTKRTLTARTWFEALRDKIVAVFEALEDEAPAALYAGAPGRFALTPWTRDAGGGGVMGMMRGRFFEKVGVHVSHVFGPMTPEMAAQLQMEPNTSFTATGVSLIAHPWNPRVPAVHMNTRFLASSRSWFGGGADLTPLLDYQRLQDFSDAQAFHAAMKMACDAYDVSWHAKYKKWCDEYFYLPHREEPRGIGGIFYDRHDSGDWNRDFAFTKSVGEALLDVYPRIARTRMHESWSMEEREQQSIRRGRYVEFNLLYDRGTMFGLKTGGNIDSILSSMPPTVKWP